MSIPINPYASMPPAAYPQQQPYAVQGNLGYPQAYAYPNMYAPPPQHPGSILDVLQSLPMLNNTPLKQAYKETMTRLLNDPTKRTQLLEMATKMQTGQMLPEEAIKNMSGLLSGAVPGSENPAGSLGALAVSIGLGTLVIKIINQSFKRLEEHDDSRLGKLLQGLEKIPGVSWANKHVENHLAQNPRPWTKKLFAEDVRTWAQLRSDFTSKYLGPKGVYHNDLNSLQRQLNMLLGAPSIDTLFNRLRHADKQREIEMLFSPDIKHFFPYRLEQAGESISGKTLAQVDDMLLRNRLIEDVGQATFAKHLNHADGKQVLEALKLTSQPVHEQIPKLLADEQLGHKLQKVWHLGTNPTLPEIRAALSFKPFDQYVNELTHGLLYDGKKPIALNAKMSETIETIAERLSKYHISNQMAGIPQWNKLKNLLGGFRSRLASTEKEYVPYAIAEQNFFKRMKDLKIGPVGRMIGKASFALEKMFAGQSFEAWGLKSLSGAGKNWRKYISVSVMIFGLSALLSGSGSKETRFSRLTDSIASGFGLYFGFEVTKNLLSQLSLLESFPLLTRISAKRLFRIPYLMKHSVTVGGFLQRFLLPSMLGGLFVPIFKKPTNWLFNDPEKLEARLKKLKSGKTPNTENSPELQALQAALSANMPQPTLAQQPYGPYPQQSPPPALSPLNAARTAATQIAEQAPKAIAKAAPAALLAAQAASKTAAKAAENASNNSPAPYVDDLGKAKASPMRIRHRENEGLNPDFFALAKEIDHAVI